VDRLKNFGFDGSHQAITAGTNGKLTELAAAIGLRQMEALPDRLRRRRAVFDAYISRLQPLGLEFQPGAERSALAFVSALLPSRAQRDALVAALDGVGVECRMYYKPPVHRHPVFAGLEGIRPLVGTEDLCSRIISLRWRTGSTPMPWPGSARRPRRFSVDDWLGRLVPFRERRAMRSRLQRAIREAVT